MRERTPLDDEPPLRIEPEWLEARLRCPDLRVIDASWYLPDAGRDARAEFAEGHIPGAVHLDLSTDLADPEAPIRNAVASPAALAERFARAGIGRDQRVVVYDRRAGYSAARVWWCLRYAGHERAGVLDGGWVRWRAEGRALEQRAIEPAPSTFAARGEPRWLANRSDVLRALRSGSPQLLDVRAGDRFRGEGPEPAPRRGHVPGARNLPYACHWRRDARGQPIGLHSPVELRRAYRDAGIDLDRPLIAMCGSGVTASLAALALTSLGHRAVRVYDGSWAEWAANPALPTERGHPRAR